MANPFAAKPNPFAAGGAKPNPFAPSSAAKPNPFAPAGSPAKPNPFAPAGSPAKPNPFASPAKPNPFAPAGATANPFAPAAAAGANPFAPKANPFAQAANPFGATTNAFGGPAGAGVPIAFAEPQDELITRALQQMTRAQTAPGSDDTLAKMESLLKPYIKTFLSTYKFRVRVECVHGAPVCVTFSRCLLLIRASRRGSLWVISELTECCTWVRLSLFLSSLSPAEACVQHQGPLRVP